MCVCECAISILAFHHYNEYSPYNPFTTYNTHHLFHFERNDNAICKCKSFAVVLDSLLLLTDWCWSNAFCE